VPRTKLKWNEDKLLSANVNTVRERISYIGGYAIMLIALGCVTSRLSQTALPHDAEGEGHNGNRDGEKKTPRNWHVQINEYDYARSETATKKKTPRGAECGKDITDSAEKIDNIEHRCANRLTE
jgi:hypothetical protein